MQPGVFMSTPKEPNFFSNDEQYRKGEDWYCSLFEMADKTDLCGESSTHYTKLPYYPDTVKRMADSLEKPKLIYVMRHPVDRLVSHYIHQWTQNVIKCDINEAIDRYDELIAYSSYNMQLQPYFEQFGCENVLPVFMEAIRSNQQQELTRIADFIGYRGEMNWFDDLASQNVSQERVRAFAGYSWLVESQFMTCIRKALIPKGLRQMIKRQFSMQQRPVINAAHLANLTRVFDKDLAELGKKLNVKIDCANYSRIVTDSKHDLRFEERN